MLVKIMADFATDLEYELKILKENMKSHTKDADNFFEGFMDHAEQLKSKFHGTMESVSSDIKVGSLVSYNFRARTNIVRMLLPRSHLSRTVVLTSTGS